MFNAELCNNPKGRYDARAIRKAVVAEGERDRHCGLRAAGVEMGLRLWLTQKGYLE